MSKKTNYRSKKSASEKLAALDKAQGIVSSTSAARDSRPKKDFEPGTNNPLPLEQRFEFFLRKHRDLSPIMARKTALKEFCTHHKIPGKVLQPFSVEDAEHNGLADSWTMVKYRPGGNLEFTALRQHQEGFLKLSPRHIEIYNAIQEQFNKPHLTAIQKATVALFIRSSGDNHYILIQVERLTPSAAKDCKNLTEWFERSFKIVKGLHTLQVSSQEPWVFVEPPKVRPPELKQWFGPGLFQIDLDSGRGQMLSFIDHFRPHRKMADVLVDKVLAELKPRPGQKLLDLYAGCGFWGQQLATHYEHTTAVDIRKIASDSAFLNAKRMGLKNYKFIHDSITPELVQKIMGEQGSEYQVILDPPPGNLPASLVTIIGQLGVQRVVRFYVEADRVAVEVKKWKREGYLVYKTIPLDTIPGSARLEYMVVYHKDKLGILEGNKIAPKKKRFVKEYVSEKEMQNTQHSTIPVFKQK